MKTLKIRDKEFSLYLSHDQIQDAVKRVAAKITADLDGKDPLFVVVLNGAFMFASDLMKYVNIPAEIAFVRLSSYVGTQTTQVVKEKISLDRHPGNRPLVIIEDIIDSGITMDSTINRLKAEGINDIRIATLLFKPGAFQKSFNIDYIGFEIPNDFIVGYGLDYDDYGRNYPDIYKIV